MDLPNNSLDLNFLLSTGNEEFVNVDDFFSNYVAELSNRSKRQVEQGGQPAGKQPKLNNTPVFGLPPSGQDSYQPAAANLPGPGGYGNLAPQDIPGMLPNGQLGQYGGAHPGLQATTAFDFPLGPGGLSHSDSGKGRNKSSKQQESNKVAQQRYRERKKQKFHEMENTISQLQQQLAQLQALQSHNQMLSGMNTELEKQLISKEREVERLKNVLDSQADASLDVDHSGASDSVLEGGGTDITIAGGCGPSSCRDDGTPCVPCDILPRDLTGIDFKSGFDDQITRLKAFLKEHNLANADPKTTKLDADVLTELGQIVGRSCQLCQAAIRAEGVRVLDLIVTQPDQLSSIECADKQARYKLALQGVNMAQEQKEQLLMMRRAHLEKMRSIYQERQVLNMAAMGLMLPHQGKNPYEDNTLEGRMANMSSGEYLPIAKSNAELTSVLDSIKDNLRQEQRAVMDLNCCLISKIFSPLQAAIYMVTSYPLHCDALALANVLALSLGRGEQGSGGNGGAFTNSIGGGGGPGFSNIMSTSQQQHQQPGMSGIGGGIGTGGGALLTATGSFGSRAPDRNLQ